MNIKFLKLNLIVLFLVINLTAYSQPEGTVLENRKITSSILGKEMTYSVYLPPDYKTSERDYPVIYLLHGIRMNSTTWIQEGEIKRYVDNAIEDGTIPTMILIMPDAGKTYYINSAGGKLRYEDFFIKELIPGVEKIYRIRSEKKYRGIAGFSMGGYGALYLALKHADFFSATATLGAAVRNDSAFLKFTDEIYEANFSSAFGNIPKGANRITPFYRAHSVLDIVQNEPSSYLSRVRYWIDCGDDDPLSEGNSLLHTMLLKKNVPHEFRVRDGAHNWNYWHSGIVDALKYIGESFR